MAILKNLPDLTFPKIDLGIIREAGSQSAPFYLLQFEFALHKMETRCGLSVIPLLIFLPGPNGVFTG